MSYIEREDDGYEWSVTRYRSDTHNGPRVGLWAEAADFENQPMDTDDLDRLILALQSAREWLLTQDPEERVCGPMKPYDWDGDGLTAKMVREAIRSTWGGAADNMIGNVAMPTKFSFLRDS